MSVIPFCHWGGGSIISECRDPSWSGSCRLHNKQRYPCIWYLFFYIWNVVEVKHLALPGSCSVMTGTLAFRRNNPDHYIFPAIVDLQIYYHRKDIMVSMLLAKWFSFLVFVWQLCTRNANSEALLLGLLLWQQPLSRIFHFLLILLSYFEETGDMRNFSKLPRSRHSIWMFESLWIIRFCYCWCL